MSGHVVFFFGCFFFPLEIWGNLYCAGALGGEKMGRALRRIMPARAPRYLGTLQPVPRRTRAGSPGPPAVGWWEHGEKNKRNWG